MSCLSDSALAHPPDLHECPNFRSWIRTQDIQARSPAADLHTWYTTAGSSLANTPARVLLHVPHRPAHAGTPPSSYPDWCRRHMAERDGEQRLLTHGLVLLRLVPCFQLNITPRFAALQGTHFDKSYTQSARSSPLLCLYKTLLAAAGILNQAHGLSNFQGRT